MDEQTRILIQEGAKLGLHIFLKSMAATGETQAEIDRIYNEERIEFKRKNPDLLPDV